MADDPNPNPNPADPADPAAVVAAPTRPDYIPESIWDGEKNAPKIDLAATLAERDALKTAADERAKEIPASPDAYSFDLPKDFELPGGYKWEADPKDPVVTGFRQLASELKLTQPEAQRLVAFEATRQAQQIQARAAFDAEQTKALGEKATERRTAISTFIDGVFTKDDPKGAMLKTMLDYAPGVEALEALIAKTNVGVRSDNPGGNPPAADPQQARLSKMYPTMAAR